jgi:hypothetical protein
MSDELILKKLDEILLVVKDLQEHQQLIKTKVEEHESLPHPVGTFATRDHPSNRED